MFLFSVLLGNGMYSGNLQVLAQENQTGNLNEAEINADIEQENKCKKDTECENENELNNQLFITNITQTQLQPTGSQTTGSQTTLNVVKILTCFNGRIDESCPPDLGPDDFTITVTGNSPSPSVFPGSEEGTLVKLGPGEYNISESTVNGNTAQFSGDCIKSGDFSAEGNIAKGQSETCTIENTVDLCEFETTNNDNGVKKLC